MATTDLAQGISIGSIYTKRAEYRFYVDTESVQAAHRKFLESYKDLNRYNYTIPAGIPGSRYLVGIPGAGRPTHFLSMNIQGIEKVANNLLNMTNTIAKEIRAPFIEIAKEILETAVKRAPLESGQLRESGRAKVSGRLVARGLANGTIEPVGSEIHKMARKDALTINVSFSDEGRVRVYRNKKTGEIRRLSVPNDFLVATWIHENLNLKAKESGTGPKYLESSFWEVATIQKIRDAIDFAISKGMKEAQGGYWRE